MKSSLCARLALALAVMMPGIVVAQNMTTDELIALAKANSVCGATGDVVGAYYQPQDATRVIVECSQAGANLLPGGMNVGAGVALGALVLIAVAAGDGGGSTPTTTGTN